MLGSSKWQTTAFALVCIVPLGCGADDAPMNVPDGGVVDPCAPPSGIGVCPARGIYDAPVRVELRAADELAIHYTLDGTVPTAESPLYTEPLTVEPSLAGMVTLRAVAVQDDGVFHPVQTHSYLFPQAVLDQPAAPIGLPPVWGYDTNTRPADYELDPRVLVGGARADAVESLRSIPVVSLVMPPQDWWTPVSGLYMRPDAVGDAWEREVSVEILGDGLSVQTNAGVQIQGNSSTRNWKSAKLSMRLAFRAIYGSGKLKAPLFAGSTVSRFENLILDAHLNHSFTHPDHEQRVIAQLARDQYISRLLNNTGSLAPQTRPVHLFLNGLYWGLYDLHERPDAHFHASHSEADDGQDSEADDWDVLRHNGSSFLAGDAVAWDQMFVIARQGLDDASRYSDIAELLDIDGFIDYMLVNFYAGNIDWDHHNWYAARNRTDAADGRFRFVSWDAEKVLVGVDDDVTAVNNNNSPTELWQRLLDSSVFVERVRQRTATLYGAGGVLSVNPKSPSWDPDNPSNNEPAAAYVELLESVRPHIVLESARWGDNQRPEMPYGLLEWDAERARLLESYFPNRSAIAEAQLP